MNLVAKRAEPHCVWPRTASNIQDCRRSFWQSPGNQFFRAFELQLKRTRLKAFRFRRLLIVATNFGSEFHRPDTSIEILYGRARNELKLVADIRASLGQATGGQFQYATRAPDNSGQTPRN